MIKISDFVDCMINSLIAREKVRGKMIKELWLVYDIKKNRVMWTVETPQEIMECSTFEEAIEVYNAEV